MSSRSGSLQLFTVVAVGEHPGHLAGQVLHLVHENVPHRLHAAGVAHIPAAGQLDRGHMCTDESGQALMSEDSVGSRYFMLNPAL